MTPGRRGWIVVLIFMAAALAFSKARADQPKLPDGYTCETVRRYVKDYGYWPALLWARANGFTASEIEAAKRCLRR